MFLIYHCRSIVCFEQEEDLLRRSRFCWLHHVWEGMAICHYHYHQPLLPMHHHYCPLCGFLICRAADSYRHFPVEDLEWYQLIRTVNGREGQFVSISGIGYFNRLDEIVAPHEPEYFYWDPRASVKTYRLANEEYGADWSFMFHAACWSILVDRVAHYGNRDVIDKIGYRLFQILHCTHVDDEGLFQPGHDYGGIARFRKPPSHMVREMLDQGYEWCFVEPSRFTSVDDILRSLKSISPPLDLVEESHSSVAASYGSIDRFANLPAEVIYLLFTWLSSDDVCRLRLASRSVASKSHRDALPQSFWRSRFFPDHEMGFALPIRIEEGYHDWRYFYFKIKQGLGLDGAEQLRNRKRIWDLVSMEAYTFAWHLSNQKV